MNRTFRLQSLLDLSNLRLDEATRELGKLIASEQEADRRVELLMQYRDEYQNQFLAAAGNGLAPETWRNYQSFLTRLDTAVDQARALAEANRQKTAVGQQHWIDQRGKVKAFDTLAQRHQARVAYADGRQEQKQSDEHGARLHSSSAESD